MSIANSTLAMRIRRLKVCYFFDVRTCRSINHLISESKRIPKREESISVLKSGKEFDILVIGGGSAGSGAALDAATRGLHVACLEREDFGSGTSSRSTQLLWGGSRYLVQAFVALFNHDLRLIRKPRETINKFTAEFKMVMNCHRERKFLLLNQPHLTHWIPIAVPLTKWIIWPPPFDYPPAALGPLGLFPLFFKFYDALGSFASPPSHIMTPARTKRKFPQMINTALKYCSVFYEGQHNDARTNLSIALTASTHGAVMGNYCNVIDFVHDDRGKIKGAVVRDELSGEVFTVKAKGILFCGGAFTDALRKLEDPNCAPAVTGASGIHVVLPAYFAPSNFGLVDMATSDGRFLFFLPWLGHVLVGTTDHRAEPTMRPQPLEEEILWVLHEASKYISPELQLRRQDVLSAWSGIRPLAVDPHATGNNTSGVSRDHIISHNAKTNVVFLSGGKWTTYREMAEDAVDKVISVTELRDRHEIIKPSNTLSTALIGKEGYSRNLPIRLVQQYPNLSYDVALHLSNSYGGRADDVCRIAREGLTEYDRVKKISPGYPYLEAEVTYCARYEWARRADDILARRTRLAFLNKDAAVAAIPKVVKLLGDELKWNEAQRAQEEITCFEYLQYFGGPKPNLEMSEAKGGEQKQGQELALESFATPHFTGRLASEEAITRAFDATDENEHGYISHLDIVEVARRLGRTSFSAEELKACIAACDVERDGKIRKNEFVQWWNSSSQNHVSKEFRDHMKASLKEVEGSGTLFG